MAKTKTKIIKDDEIAKLASKLQKRFGRDLASCWNTRTMEILYDEGDCRAPIVAIIKEWRVEMGRDEETLATKVSEHYEELRKAEERGYSRGLQDGVRKTLSPFLAAYPKTDKKEEPKGWETGGSPYSKHDDDD